MIIIPLILGTFLRVYKILSNYYFTGELGKELIYVWQIILSAKFPLIGMGTSHEWLSYGPIYYWILMPIIKIFGWSPYILFWVSLVVSMGGVLITYFVFKKIIDKRFAIILSSFISLSPIWIWAARLSKLHTFFFIFTPLIIYCLYKIWNGKNKYIFWLGISFGALFSFHFSQIPILLVVILMFWMKRKNLKFKNYLMFIAGLIIPNITVITHDALNGFSMIKNLLLWIPYRFAGFAGIYPKNNLNLESGTTTLSAFNEFFGRNIFWDSRLWILGSILFITLFITILVQNRKKYSKDFFIFYIVTSTIVQCFALLIHTRPPLHYFFPIFLNFGLMFSYFASELWFKKSTKFMTVAIFILMFLVSVIEINKEHVNDTDYIPLTVQDGVATTIVDDAAGRAFSLERVGPYDYFPENYSQNYQFLIRSKGGSVDQSASLKYIILEMGEVYIEKHE